MRPRAVLAWTFVGCITLLVGFGLGGALGSGGFGLFLVFPGVTLIFLLIVFGGPIALIVVGIAKRKWEMVAGSIGALLILFGASVVSDWLEMRHLAQQVEVPDMRPFAAAQARHSIIAQEYSQSTDCDQLCQLILVNSDYAVAVGGPSYNRVVYRKISHNECLETQYVRHNVRFFGVCATTDTVAQIGDALLIQTPMNFEALDTFRDLGYRFTGTAFAFVERQEGQDRVLGRWISGKIKTSWFESEEIGGEFTREAFYRAALGMRLSIDDLKHATWLWEGL